MKQTLVLIITLALMGCKSGPMTSQQNAAQALSYAETGVKLAIGPAITGWLLLQKDPVQRSHDAGMVYAAAVGVNSLATGTTWSPDQVKAVVQSFLGSNDQRYINLAQIVANEYTNIYPLFGVAGTTPAKFLGEISTTAMNSASAFIDPNATPAPTVTPTPRPHKHRSSTPTPSP